MKTKRLTDVLEREENWPAEWQEQLADIALDIDTALRDGVYHSTLEELEGSIAACATPSRGGLPRMKRLGRPSPNFAGREGRLHRDGTE